MSKNKNPIITMNNIDDYNDFNNTQSEIKKQQLHVMVEEQCIQKPNEIALITPQKKIIYRELKQEYDKIANFLIENCVEPNTLVAIVMEKGWEQITSAIGILKSGAAYIPINANYPIKRIQELLSISNVKYVLTQEKFHNKLAAIPYINCLNVNDTSYLNTYSKNLSIVECDPSNLAYVIFTSGTTGIPKGVMISHESALNTIYFINKQFDINSEDIFWGISSLDFDLSVYDIFGSLSVGATLLLPNENDRNNPAAWEELFSSYPITVWNSVPSLMQLYLDYFKQDTSTLVHTLNHLKTILFSGDWIAKNLIKTLSDVINNQTKIISLGGATEGSVWSIYFPVENIHPSWVSIPYGKPLTNQQIYIVNEELEPLPSGEEGEIVIAGDGVAIGYWNDEALTNKKFIYHNELGRIYRTGDSGILNNSGYIELLGRIDEQIKIEGIRIEPGEIEYTLENLPEIREAVVVKFMNKSGHEQLAAFLTTNNKCEKDKIITYLRKVLPTHLIPKKICFIDNWPLTSNAKKDRKALVRLLTKNEDNQYNLKNYTLHREKCIAQENPAKFNQVGIIYQTLSDPEANYYLIQTSWTYQININLTHYLNAWKILISKVETLRSYFDLSNLESIKILTDSHIDFEYKLTDYSHSTSVKQRHLIKTFEREERNNIVNLEKSPVFRLNIIKTGEDQYHILFTLHHSLCDRWSIYLIIKELHNIYENLIKDNSISSHQYPLVHLDYNDRNIIKAKEFWKNELADIKIESSLSDISQKQETCTNKGISKINYKVCSIDAKSKHLLYHSCKEIKVTPASFMMTCWNITLLHLLSTSTICSGFSVSGRLNSKEDMWSNIGLFANVVPFISNINENIVFDELAKISHRKISELNKNDQLSLAEILNQTKTSTLEKKIDHVVIISSSLKPGDRTGLDNYTSAIGFHEITPYPLLLTINLNEQITIDFAYNQTFSNNFIESIANTFINISQQAINNPKTLIKEFSPLSEHSKQKLIYNLQGKQNVSAFNDDILSKIKSNIYKYKNKEAIECNKRIYTYADLGEWLSNLTTKYQFLLKTNSTAILYFDRSIEYLVAILTCLELKITFIPIGINTPNKRITDIISQIDNPIVITSNKYKKNLESTDISPLCIEDTSTFPAPPNSKIVTNSNNDIAYIFFTSGSSGKPKGVNISRMALNNQINSITNTIKPDQKNNFAAITRIMFDISLVEFLMPLISGSKLFIPNRLSTTNTKKLIDYINSKHISILQTTPSRWNLLLEENIKLPYLKIALCGGERLTGQILNKLKRLDAKIFNLYGPTETTIWTTIAELSDETDEIPIGKPLENNQLIVLNRYQQLVPPYIPGELYIGGRGIGSGYLSKNETSQSFLSLPNFSGRFYKTGDLCLWNNESMYYINRLDRQIKIRGNRVDLHELENFALKDKRINQAAAVTYNDSIYLFLTPKNSTTQTPPKLGLFFFASLDENENVSDFYDWYIEIVKKADEFGLSSVWIPERHFDSLGAPFASSTLLNATFSACTNNIQLRSGSIILPLHNTLHVIEQWSMLDNISKGRSGMAVASGWNPNDFTLAPDNYQDRKNIMFEQIKYIREVWKSGKTEKLNGNNERVSIEIFPKPFQKQLPIWVAAASSPDTFLESGKLGLNILTHLLVQNPEQLNKHIRLYQESLEEHNHQINEHNITLMLHTFVLDNGQQAKDIARPVIREYLKKHLDLIRKGLNKDLLPDVLEERIKSVAEEFIQNKSLIGSPEECMKVIEKHYQQGIDEIACLVDFGLPREQIEKSLENIAYINKHLQSRTMSRPLVISTDKLHKDFKSNLPSYMVPQNIILEDQLPINDNGKIDYDILINKVKKIFSNSERIEEDLNEIEATLKKIWVDILETDNFYSTDEFFAIGGHSLQAMQLISKISKTFNVDISLQAFLQHSSIEKLAVYIEDMLSKLSAVEKHEKNTPLKLAEVALSPSQNGLWFIHQVYKDSSAYNDSFIINIKGSCNKTKLIDALKKTISSNLIFNLKFSYKGQGIIQSRKKHSPNIMVENIPHKYKGIQGKDIKDRIKYFSNKTFEIEHSDLYRFVIFQFENKILLLIIMHHIITDGDNLILLANDLLNNYSGIEKTENQTKFDYFDFINYQNKILSDKDLPMRIAQYIEAGNISSLSNNLTFTKRPEVISHNGCKKSILISDEQFKNIHTIIKKYNMTLFSYILSIYYITLFHFAKEDNIQIGFPMSLRDPDEFHDVLGLFVNMGIINCSRPSNNSQADIFLTNTKEKIINSLVNRHIPIDKIIETLNVSRELSYNSLFQYAFSFYEKYDFISPKQEISFEVMDFDFGIARYDVELQASTYNNHLRCDFIFNSDILNSSYQELFIKIFKKVIIDCGNNIIKFHPYTLEKNSSLMTIQHWHELYERIYTNMPTNISPDFNTAGWVSSATKKQFPKNEMIDWRNNAIEKINVLTPRNILEIGCGTGLLTHRLSENYQSYVGIDFSATVIDYLKKNISFENCEFHVMKAYDIDQLPSGQFDTIILNSIVQYFPSLDYLINVIGKACNLLDNKAGAIFIGDIRNYDWRYEQSFYNLQNRISTLNENEKYQQIEKQINNEKELLVSPMFFAYLATIFPGISGFQITPKQTNLPNELNLFRYDVTFYLNNEQLSSNEEFITCHNVEQLVSVFENNSNLQPKYIYLKNILNKDIFELNQNMHKQVPEVEINDINITTQNTTLRQIIDILPNHYTINIELSVTNPLFYDVILIDTNSALKLRPFEVESNIIDLNKISSSLNTEKTAKKIEKLLQQSVNDKASSRITLSYETNTLTEFLITEWKELLNVDIIKIDDNFFDIGGDSISSIQFVNKLRNLGINISALDFMKNQTIESLVNCIQKLNVI